MHVFSRLAPALLALAPLVAAAPAHADKVTLGSTLSAPATIVESHGADTAFWPTQVTGAAVAVPADGQIISIRMKGAAMKEPGAPNDPANMVHFQSLEPAGASGSRQVYYTSGFFDMPVGTPDAITTFAPENLCVHQGGSVAFNTIGGFGWAGGDPFNPNPVPDNPPYYKTGTPWRIFAAAPTSTTAWYSKDNGTKNGDVLKPSGGANAIEGQGATMAGKELLMQVVLATGDDVSYECGGPRRDGSGNVLREMSVNAGQDAFVGRDGSFKVFGYCGSARGDCTNGTMTVAVAGKTISTAPFSAAMQKDIVATHKLSVADYVALANAPDAAQTATVTLTNALGTFTGTIKLHTVKGGAIAIPAQKPYVANDRSLKPYAICSLVAGCKGTATLTAKGKTIGTATFSSRKSGAILFNMRLTASAFKTLKKAKTMAATLTVRGIAGTRTAPLTLRK
ncbi:MAG: hypothetical protein JWM73_1695 [Solirubrobacterales bacterium]|nr:hypothetical protein [Solirubrobacterales bacterium]